MRHDHVVGVMVTAADYKAMRAGGEIRGDSFDRVVKRKIVKKPKRVKRVAARWPKRTAQFYARAFNHHLWVDDMFYGLRNALHVL